MADVLQKYFGNLQAIFEEVLKLKNSAGERNVELAEKRKKGALQFVVLKKINRQVKYDLRSGRDELHREKLQVDSNRLQLQNLLYEVNHLKREIRRCHQFKSQDEDIELLPEEEYCALVKPESIPETKHAKRLAHLEWELALRKQLSEQCKDLLNSKKQVFQDIVLRVERLTSFAPSLRQLLKATQPLQEALQLPMEREWKLSQLVQLLPQPLYLAYMNVHALEKSFGEGELQTSVVGGEDEVHQSEVELQLEQLKQRSSSDTDDVEVSSKKRRHDDHPDLLQVLRQRALEPHPLMVRCVFANRNSLAGSEQLVVTLRYFQHLRFVTAATTAVLSETESAPSELALLQDVLRLLYSGDEGDTLPVSGAQHELQKFGVSAEQCLQQLISKEYGRPFRWLQRMCGLEAYSDGELEAEEAQQPVLIPAVVQRLHKLWLARLNLLRQIKALIGKNIELYLKEEQLPSVRPACSLVQWTSVSWEEYAENAATQAYIDSGLALSHQVFYRAVVVRGSAKMECLINVPSQFPDDNSLWAICIHWNGEHNARNNSSIKMMEQWVNALEQHMLKHRSALLAAQLLRTMYSFDIYLETESANFSPVEFPKEKHYIRPVALRIRARPFKAVEGSSENLFKQ